MGITYNVFSGRYLCIDEPGNSKVRGMGGADMPQTIQSALEKYISEIKRIYGNDLKKIVLYGSYARGDFREDSDIDIMILLDLPDNEIKNYRHQLSDITYDFNMDYDMDIKPIAKNEEHFMKWVENYPFYANINKEGITLYGAA